MAVLPLFQFKQGQMTINLQRIFFNFTYVISFCFQDKIDYSLVGLPMAITICKTEKKISEQSNPSQKLLTSNWDLGKEESIWMEKLGTSTSSI
jgi:hypothetical protein